MQSCLGKGNACWIEDILKWKMQMMVIELIEDIFEDEDWRGWLLILWDEVLINGK